jgi:antitoxin HigA-1
MLIIIEGKAMPETVNFRMKSPSHPGTFVKSEILDPAKLNVTGAAEALGVTRPALSAFLNGRAALSADMAIRLEKAFGVGMETLMRMQNSHDIAKARLRADEINVARFAGKLNPASA